MMRLAFWDIKPVTLLVFLEFCQAISSNRYVATLTLLNVWISKIKLEKRNLCLQRNNIMPYTSMKSVAYFDWILGYLMPHPVYTYTLNMICKPILPLTFLTEPELIFFTQLNGFEYFYQIRIITFTINHFFTLLNGCKYCYVSLTNQLNSYLFIQLNDQTVLLLRILFSISHLFGLSLNIQTVLFELQIGPYQELPPRVRVDLGAIAMKRYSAFP